MEMLVTDDFDIFESFIQKDYGEDQIEDFMNKNEIT